MPDLGPEFDYFGEAFHFAPEVDPFLITEFAELLDDGADSVGMRALAVTWRLALSCVAESDRDRFRQVSRRNKAKTGDYMRVFAEWTTEETGRPTQRPSDSSPGPEHTEPKSETPPAPAVISAPSEPERPVRPDLQLAILRSA